MKRLNEAGFSMIELLVVLLIIGILSAVAAPMFLQNTGRSKASEAVAAEGAIRSAERSYVAQSGGCVAVGTGGAPDGTTYFGTNGSNSSYLGLAIHGNKYFSPKAYIVAITTASGCVGTAGLSWGGTPASNAPANPQDFIITATGNNSQNLSGAATTCGGGADANGDGAANCSDVANFKVQMDNAGQVIYTTDGTNWYKY